MQGSPQCCGEWERGQVSPLSRERNSSARSGASQQRAAVVEVRLNQRHRTGKCNASCPQSGSMQCAKTTAANRAAISGRWFDGMYRLLYVCHPRSGSAAPSTVAYADSKDGDCSSTLRWRPATRRRSIPSGFMGGGLEGKTLLGSSDIQSLADRVTGSPLCGE